MWNPRCQVILYPTVESYVAAVGRGAESTLGSSLVQPSVGKIRLRRIDLRTDVENYLQAAVPHEMCHLLVADRHRDRPAPLWYDEGLALLADEPAKLKLHQRDLDEGIRRRTAFRLSELLLTDSYPAADRMGVFYGQCAGLTQLLLREGAPDRLHQFATLLPSFGASASLKATYGIDGIDELETLWNSRGATSPIRPAALLLPKHRLSEPIRFASFEP